MDPDPINNSTQPDESAQPNLDTDVRFRCVKEGKRLRVRIISPKYNHVANCQFPRNIRKEGAEYLAPRSAVSFARGPRGKFFYRVKRSQVRVVQPHIDGESDKSFTSVKKIFEDEDDTCVICMEAEKEIVYVPCGHYYVCSPCDKIMKKRVCPICRSVIEQAVGRDKIQT